MYSTLFTLKLNVRNNLVIWIYVKKPAHNIKRFQRFYGKLDLVRWTTVVKADLLLTFFILNSIEFRLWYQKNAKTLFCNREIGRDTI